MTGRQQPAFRGNQNRDQSNISQVQRYLDAQLGLVRAFERRARDHESAVDGRYPEGSRIADVRRLRGARWALFALLFLPAVTLISYGVVRYFSLPLPDVILFTPAAAPGLFAMFFINAIPEEIGWTGYATEPLQKRYGVFGAGLIIGVVWAPWHVAMWWVGDGWEGQDDVLAVAGQAASVILLRVVMGWMYATDEACFWRSPCMRWTTRAESCSRTMALTRPLPQSSWDS
jgi:hypothetical protein